MPWGLFPFLRKNDVIAMKATLREKWRYITLRINGQHMFTKDQFERALTNALLRLVGEIGYAQLMARVILFDKNSAILRVRRDGAGLARSALPLISNLDRIPVHLQTVYVSGTRRKSKTKQGKAGRGQAEQ